MASLLLSDSVMEKLLSEAHQKAIGHLVVTVSRLDSIITDLISQFLETDIVRTIIVVHHQQFSSKAENLLALCNLAFGKEPQFEPILQMIKEAKEIADFRNTVVHAYWNVDEQDTAYAVRFSSRGEFSRTRNPYTAQQIQEKADEGVESIRKLSALRDHFLEEKSKTHTKG